MNRIKLALLGVAAAVGLAAGVAACGGPAAYPTPASYTIPYGNTVYCPYEYDEHEIDMYGQFDGYNTCTRVAFPSLSAVPTTGLQLALMGYWTTYSGFYESGYWYDTYYQPLGARYHVTVISRTSYLSNVSTYQRTYASQIKTNSAKATWTGGKTGTYKFPTSNQAATKPLTNTGGGNAGANNQAPAKTGAKPAAPAPKPAAPAGKPGGRR